MDLSLTPVFIQCSTDALLKKWLDKLVVKSQTGRLIGGERLDDDEVLATGASVQQPTSTHVNSEAEEHAGAEYRLGERRDQSTQGSPNQQQHEQRQNHQH